MDWAMNMTEIMRVCGEYFKRQNIIKLRRMKWVPHTFSYDEFWILELDPSTTKDKIAQLEVHKARRINQTGHLKCVDTGEEVGFWNHGDLEFYLDFFLKKEEIHDETKANRIEKFQASLNDEDVDRFFGVIIMRLRNEHLLDDIDVDTVWMALGSSLKEKLAKKMEASKLEVKHGDAFYAWAALDKLASILNSV
jgi:hypothetical protein